MEPVGNSNHGFDHIFAYACYTGDTSHLARLITEGKFQIDKCIPEIGPANSLVIAVLWKSFPVTSLLLNHGADPDTNGGLALKKAIFYGRRDIVCLLLDHGANPNILDADLETNALTEAVELDRLDLVQLLLDRGADVTLDDLDAFRFATSWGTLESLELLLSHAIQVIEDNPEVLDEFDKNDVWICKAVLDGDAAKVAKILETGLFEDCGDFENFYLQGVIYRIKDPEVTKAFVRAGVARKIIFLKAMAEGDAELQKFCLDSPNFDPDSLRFEKDALFEACCFHQLEIIKILVNEYGHDLNRQSSDGSTPLYSIHKPNLLREVLSIYPEIDLNVITNEGNTLLSYRSACDFYAILLQHGADPCFPNENLHNSRSMEDIDCNENPDCPVVQHMQKLLLIDSDYVEKMIPKILVNTNMKAFKKLTRLQLEKDCEDEILQMQSLRISQSTSYINGKSLFNFIFFKPNEAARYARNIEILKMYDEHDQNFQNYLQHYGFALNYQLRRAQVRRNQFESALDMLSLAMGCGLPEDFAEEIFGFFSNRHLNSYNLNK